MVVFTIVDKMTSLSPTNCPKKASFEITLLARHNDTTVQTRTTLSFLFWDTLYIAAYLPEELIRDVRIVNARIVPHNIHMNQICGDRRFFGCNVNLRTRWV